MDFNELKQAVGDLDEEVVLDILNKVMEDGGSQAQEALEACQRGLDIVGDMFDKGEYFVGDLIFAGELMTQAVDILKPALAGTTTESVGKVILCTVEGDLHDIGKNIVRSILEANGIEVIDLGIDTPPQKIVDTMIAEDIHVVLLSGVLTLALDSMKKTVDAITAAGLRETTKILIGGNPVSEEAMKLTGADAWAHNPQHTNQACLDWLKK